MVGYELNDQEKALVAEYEKQARAVGLDGVYNLEPHERGLVCVASLVRSQTLLQVFTALGLGGKAAKEAAFNAGAIDIPTNPEELRAKLQALFDLK